MKAIKGCVNGTCEEFKKKRACKEKFKFCPICGEKLEYVCADCWKVLDSCDEKYCISCKAKREQKNARRIDQAKVAVGAVVGTIGVALNKKEEVLELGKKVIKVIKK